ncbi:MAG: glycosyltransferase family 2 protein [Oscillospiraceae bacterium]|nr:glycosyltransferase family 2 protein [Oscillospiraceae bacterium]
MSVLYIVVPCYNEEAVILETAKRLLAKLTQMIDAGKCRSDSRILFVDDGSRDKTWTLISGLHRENGVFSGIKLAKNRGHQNALLCGLLCAEKHCDCAISIDADLQDDIDVMDKFLDEFHGGSDLVLGVRSSRKTDTVFKRATAQGFYKFMNLLGVEVIYNHADYRLMSRRALKALGQYKEVNLFLRGIISDIGFKRSVVTFERRERFAGTSKYPFKKMISFALDGITSFSVKPIKFISSLGIAISILSVAGLLYALVSKLFFPESTVSGWTAIVASIWLIGGIQLFSLGIIGQYVGKIYSETKARPKYIVEEMLI